MQWLKENVVGLLTACVLVGGSYGVLYSDVRVENNNNIRQDIEIKNLQARQLAESTTLQSTILRLTSLESQTRMLADTNQRVLVALDKIDVLYVKVATDNAVQDERILTMIKQIESKENPR